MRELTDAEADRLIERLIAHGLAERIHTDRGEEIKITEEGREYLERAKGEHGRIT